MASEYVLWWNSRCSKSQAALELLKKNGIEPELRRYLEEPPTVAELEELLRKLGLPAHAIARSKEDEYQSLRLSDRASREELLQAFVAHPAIIERPILVRGERALVARPPERVLELLDHPPVANG
jgi:arsenate reductase